MTKFFSLHVKNYKEAVDNLNIYNLSTELKFNKYWEDFIKKI